MAACTALLFNQIPRKPARLAFSFIEILVLYFCGYDNFYIVFYNVRIASFRVATG